MTLSLPLAKGGIPSCLRNNVGCYLQAHSSCNGTSSHHQTGKGRGAAKLTTPYAANDEAISLIKLTRDGFSASIDDIPAFYNIVIAAFCGDSLTAKWRASPQSKYKKLS
ncbi:hypothetical protein [Desulfosporosinus sp. BG]|uniref:hypothetical protein n=1 Tax=Desulfosporosinus sp. BG TaxID=1633135 RepID=UPI00083A0ED9|nr:hypothetical protein [Desulfosporosinus sp. BG]